ncbi:uncharacterized protein A1O9_05942 [Exophiala aquamarina CBS 119918]|uniref:Exosome complex protein n=1 Tax=Exophiala aquamarina CBS 119918 TaxID=1182545 RepID=A0A072PD40_9EURO|nr:uncharacterized protein A1O9_05942 [Exophiala aquamarina CBS 119918]KEF58019.1 hypothetical protein A1O9_05942 [Exophiala aquamarina CBS 119918]
MNTKSVLDLVDQLADDLEDLEETLEPLLVNSLITTTKKLPLLDRAKLNVLLVYAIESLIFSHLRLHGVQAKEHPVFRELSRVKQYFEKIKEAEAEPTKSQPHLVLDKKAAGRFIKHALAGNDQYDLERREREAREKLLAKRKLKSLEAIMKEKAEASAQEDAEAEATALAAAQEAAQLIAMDLEEGEISDQDISSSVSSDSGDEGVLGTTTELRSSSTSDLIPPEPHTFDQEQQSLSGQSAPLSPALDTGKRGKKRKHSTSTGSQTLKQAKATAKKQRKQARKASMAGSSKSQPAPKAKKPKKPKKAKKTKVGTQNG